MEKPLYIPPSKKTTGLKIWCDICRTDVSETCHKDGVPLKKCKNGGAHSFRLSIYKKGSKKRIIEKLETRDLEKAIPIAMLKRAKIKNETEVRVFESKNNSTETKLKLTLVEAMTLYLAHLSGKRGPAHTIKVRTRHHIWDVEKSMVLFGQAIKKNGFDPKKLDITEFANQEMVGFYHDFLLKNKHYSNRTYNRYMSHMSSLFNYLNRYEGFDIKNPFNVVQKRKAITDIKTINAEWLKKLFNAISKEQGIQVLSTGDEKNHFFPFTKNSIKLGLLTGVRREELVSMRFCDVEEDENGQPVVIASNNLKRNRIMNAEETGDIKITPVPVTPQLRNLLYEMEYEENRGTDKYILAPDSLLKRKTLMDIISKSFTHYAKIAGLPSDISFRHLRKTFATKMQIVLGDNSHLVTGHSSQKILNDHYINKSVIARVASNQDIFPEFDLTENDKKVEEIKQIREEQKHKENPLER